MQAGRSPPADAVSLYQKIASLTRGKLAQNALALYGVTVATSLLPLLTVPYLARVLGPGAWGMVLFAQTLAIWPAMLVEFGFVYSATREVARHSGDAGKLRALVGEVMACKLGLSAVGALVGIGFWLWVPAFQQNPSILLGALWLAIVQGLNPLWYFQGIERLRLPALIEVVCRVLFTVSVFFLIKEPGDATRVIFYQALSVTVSLGITLSLMYRTVGFSICGFARALRALREAWPFFLFVAIMNLKGSANGFMLGLLVTPAIVSFYGGPERLLRGFLSLTTPISQVLYPRLTYLVKHDLRKARNTVRKGTQWFAAMGVLLGLALTFGAPWLVGLLFGPGYERGIPVLRVLGVACPFAALNSVMGVSWMFPLGHERIYKRIVMAGAALDLVLVLVLTPWLEEFGAALALCATEIFITATVFAVLWRMRLNPFQDCGAEQPSAPVDSHPLTVGLNGRFSGTLKPTGMQVASFHLFDAIIRSERDFPVVVFADAAFPGTEAWRAIPRTRFVDVPFSRWHRSVAQLWEQCILPIRAAKAGCSVLHHPMTTCPRWRNGIKQVVTVHDLNFLHHPEWISRAFRHWLSATAIPAIKQADHVATISDYVLADVRRTLGIAAAKSSRIYNGLTPLPLGLRQNETARVILGINLWQPHKNLPRLIEAFTLLRSEVPALELHLAGRPQANYRAQPEFVRLLARPGVRLLGYLSEQELSCAYANASAVCYPSLEEGFGLPVLEAMAAGTPVVTSDTSCLPEIAGGAAVLVDPFSPESIAAGIRAVLGESSAERARRIALGRQVAAGFEWGEAARQYAAIYHKLAG